MRESQVHTLAPNLTLWTLKMWAYSSKNRQNRYFLVTISLKGVYPFNEFFYRIWRGEGFPRLYPYAKFFCWAFENVDLEPPNIFGQKGCCQTWSGADYRNSLLSSGDTVTLACWGYSLVGQVRHVNESVTDVPKPFFNWSILCVNAASWAGDLTTGAPKKVISSLVTFTNFERMDESWMATEFPAMISHLLILLLLLLLKI